MFFFIFLISLNIIIFFNYKYISNKIQVYDIPDNKRKIHDEKVTKIGGIIFFVNTILITIYLEKFKLDENLILFFFILFSTFFISLIDDLKDIKPIYRLISFYFLFLIWVIIDPNMQINSLKFITFNIDINIEKYSYFITPLFILIFLNALNLYDGVNGQSASYLFLFLAFFYLNNLNTGLYLFFIPFLSIFFFYNISNKIFLGDTGITLFAVYISYILIKDYNLNQNLYCDEIFLIMMLPGIDMLRVYLERLIKKKDPFLSDKSHLHHILLRKIPKQYVFLYQFVFISIILASFYLYSINFLFIFFTVLFLYFLTLIFFNAKNTKI
tara:strand:+ start:1452 stop:2432 length:981 start_codon:yes stop_codon:yes gene_type:complete